LIESSSGPEYNWSIKIHRLNKEMVGKIHQAQGWRVNTTQKGGERE
jgi:hypothetical protein